MFNIDFGQEVIPVPAGALQCGAGSTELRLLLLLCSGKTYREKSTSELAGLLDISEDEVKKGLDFLLKEGLIYENSKKPKQKALRKDQLPTYSGLELEQVLQSEKALAVLIDECQKIVGHIFTPTEAGKVAAIYKELGLSCEHIMLMFCYYFNKLENEGRHLTVAYIEKAAYGLFNDGIDTLEGFEIYVRDQEQFQSITGRIRRLFGIGDRRFTKTETNYFTKWIKEWKMSYELIEFAYEITVDSTGKAVYPYMSKIMSGWHDKNIETYEQAEKEADGFRRKNDTERTGDPTYSDTVAPSFDADRFFDKALKRSYEAMKNIMESEDKS